MNQKFEQTSVNKQQIPKRIMPEENSDLGNILHSSKNSEPFELLLKWVEDAKNKQVSSPVGMNLATIGPSGSPRNRMVLMRYVKSDEIGFYTNLGSSKSQEIIANPAVSATIWWPELERQVRIEGIAIEQTRENVEQYFHSRPRNSQIAAWSSKQSTELSSMDELSKRFERFEKEFAGKEVPLPDFWGGYVIKPKRVEYWSGRPFRMHERIILDGIGESDFKTFRLFP